MTFFAFFYAFESIFTTFLSRQFLSLFTVFLKRDASAWATPYIRLFCSKETHSPSPVPGMAGWWVGWVVAGWLVAGWLAGCWLVGWLLGMDHWFRLNKGELGATAASANIACRERSLLLSRGYGIGYGEGSSIASGAA